MTPSTYLSSITLKTEARLRYFVSSRKTRWSTWRPSSTLCSIGTHHVMSPLPTWLLFTFSLNLLAFSAWMISLRLEKRASTPQMMLRSPTRPLTFWFPCWVCHGAMWCTTVQRKWEWQLAALCLQTALTYHLTEGCFQYIWFSLPLECSHFCSKEVSKWFSSCRYIYIVDIMDHDVDVYERQDGEQLVFLKVVKCF